MSLRQHVFRFLSSSSSSIFSRTVTTCTSDASEEIIDLPTVDCTQTKVILDNTPCNTPEEAKTDLVKFLDQADILKRTQQMKVPFFTPGSTMRIIYTDPSSRTGRNHFAGLCIARSNKGLGSTFILRNTIQGVGVERMFELYSPHLIDIQVLKLERRRRAKLYYLRDKPPKYSTVKESMEPVSKEGDKVTTYRRRGAPA